MDGATTAASVQGGPADRGAACADFEIPEPQHAQAGPLKEGGPARVVGDLLGVLAAVEWRAHAAL